MFNNLNNYITNLSLDEISTERKLVLRSLIDYINTGIEKKEDVNLNFICTHNSRRSHLAQIWAQTMASYFNLSRIFCYSGGTESTAMFSKIEDILTQTGFKITKLSNESNPVYAIKYGLNCAPVICFSKEYNHPINPNSNFAAVMTCDSADQNCPFIPGALRISVKYKDPKESDNTPQQNEIYLERSKQIATEMKYVFSKIIS